MDSVLCSGPNYSIVHQGLLHSFVQPSVPQPVSPEIATQSMLDLVGAVAVCQKATSTSTCKQRQAAYNDWTRYLNLRGTCPTAADPSHAVAYLHAFSKRGTFLTPEGPRCAPGTLKNQIGYLRKGSALYAGRAGPYCPRTGQGAWSRC